MKRGDRIKLPTDLLWISCFAPSLSQLCLQDSRFTLACAFLLIVLTKWTKSCGKRCQQTSGSSKSEPVWINSAMLSFITQRWSQISMLPLTQHKMTQCYHFVRQKTHFLQLSKVISFILFSRLFLKSVEPFLLCSFLIGSFVVLTAKLSQTRAENSISFCNSYLLHISMLKLKPLNTFWSIGTFFTYKFLILFEN